MLVKPFAYLFTPFLQEKEHMEYVKQREKQDSKKEGSMRKSTSLYGDAK